MKMSLDDGTMKYFVKKIHFVGIGGVGMSGIAEVLNNLGYQVSGSDLTESEITHRLQKRGIKVFYGHRPSNVRGAHVVVISSAVNDKNPEVKFAKTHFIPVVLRAQMLAEIGRMKKTITVAGTHGKTTTTSLVSMALRRAGAEPTMIIGGQLKNINSNVKLGLGEYMVAEADESDGSFLYLSPFVAVATNVDDDHMDHYRTLDALKASFVRHLNSVPFYGAVVLCQDDNNLMSLAKQIERRKITYGFKPQADWQARNLKLQKTGTRSDIYHHGKKILSLKLKVPGRHNVLNALAALAVGQFLGLSTRLLAEGLSSFQGVGRRLDVLGSANGVEFIDDYGHHPTEVKTTLDAVKLWKAKRLIVIFQPHRYSRTKMLARKFGPAFLKADFVHVMDIYPAGEKPIKGVSSKLILNEIGKTGVKCAAFKGALEIAKQLKSGDVVLTLGAGDVWKVGEDLLRRQIHHVPASI